MSLSHVSNLWGKYCDYYHFTCEERCWAIGTRWEPKLGIRSVRNEVSAIEHSSILPKCLEATVMQYWNGSVPFSSVQLLRCVWLFVTPWTAACQASLSITKSWSLPKLMFTELVMPSNRLVLCHPLLLPPSNFPSIRVFSKESVLCIRWPKYWSFSISPSREYSGLISFRIDWFDPLATSLPVA